MVKVKRKGIYTFLAALLIFIDILINISTGGAIGETISSRTGKLSLLHNPIAKKFESFVDYLFTWKWVPLELRYDNHCFYAIDWEVGTSKEDMIYMLYDKWVDTKDIKYMESLERIGAGQ